MNPEREALLNVAESLCRTASNALEELASYLAYEGDFGLKLPRLQERAIYLRDEVNNLHSRIKKAQ